MRYIPDITVYDRNDDIVMLVEVKVKTGTNKVWAKKMYYDLHNLFAERHISPVARYFLLALPDQFYLWEIKSNTPEIMEPDWIIDPLPFLEPYYKKIGRDPGSFGHDSFKMIISSWLSEILLADTPDLLSEYDSWLFDSGLGEALIGGRLGHEVPV